MSYSTQQSWPDGATWVFQGTVAEDGTGGTHVCTLTVTPGAGNEIQVLYGSITVGNTATAQLVAANIDDGTNHLAPLVTRSLSGTSASAEYAFPDTVNSSATTNQAAKGIGLGILVSGTMRLVLSVTTAAISVTQTFAVVCRIKGGVPTATLADTVGTPTLTTNTSKVF